VRGGITVHSEAAVLQQLAGLAVDACVLLHDARIPTQLSACQAWCCHPAAASRGMSVSRTFLSCVHMVFTHEA
jgi:hypothetical protein